jgi:hypothetical protein
VAWCFAKKKGAIMPASKTCLSIQLRIAGIAFLLAPPLSFLHWIGASSSILLAVNARLTTFVMLVLDLIFLSSTASRQDRNRLCRLPRK